MKTEMNISFPGGKKVDARVRGFTIHTDQKKDSNGDDSAPTPFEMFVASIGTCTGMVAQDFCRTRGLHTDGMTIDMEYEKDEKSGRYRELTVSIRLPENFPEKYRKPFVRAIDQCTVKKHILEPPDFNVSVC